MISQDIIEKIQLLFASFPSLKIAYLFGSQAQGNTGKMSDYDFAVFFDGQDKKKNFEIKLELMSKLGLLLKSNDVDVVLLNNTDAPELKYAAITQGKIIYEKNNYRILVEPKILNEYFDFHAMLKRYALTKA